MVRNYKRKTERGKVPEETMLKAVLEVKYKKRSVRAVSQEFGIPRKTLGRYCEKFKAPTEPPMPIQPKSSETEPLPQTVLVKKTDKLLSLLRNAGIDLVATTKDFRYEIIVYNLL